ncbi:hypothetical protein [Sphingomonas sp.]|jgi:hypothetical protein|uniref:hypothetical protein n=1 Tax=Sphingomonas sp. TaxID=28214 RepID=UPI002EDA80A7
MLEFTMGGAWFRWSAFDKRSKALATASMSLGAISGLLIGMAVKPVNTRLQFDVAQHVPALAFAGLAAAALATWLWHSFSLLQDEMFNRVQKWTLGMAGAWTCALSGIWAILAASSLTAPMPSAAPALLFAATTFVLWFVAVRKWA